MFLVTSLLRRDGEMERWRDGEMEYWSIGVLEWWIAGVLGRMSGSDQIR
jgi:hypothetical protein